MKRKWHETDWSVFERAKAERKQAKADGCEVIDVDSAILVTASPDFFIIDYVSSQSNNDATAF